MAYTIYSWVMILYNRLAVLSRFNQWRLAIGLRKVTTAYYLIIIQSHVFGCCIKPTLAGVGLTVYVAVLHTSSLGFVGRRSLLNTPSKRFTY